MLTSWVAGRASCARAGLEAALFRSAQERSCRHSRRAHPPGQRSWAGSPMRSPATSDIPSHTWLIARLECTISRSELQNNVLLSRHQCSCHAFT